MSTYLLPYEMLRPMSHGSELSEHVMSWSGRSALAPRSPSIVGGESHVSDSRPRPLLAPTIAPLGHERLIAVRSIRDCDVVVTGGATGRAYHFAAGQSREIPLSDARLLVAEGDFGFSGGR
jgi:hypothetical protein